MPRYVINPHSSATIHFADSEAGLGAGQDATFQITSFVVSHSPQSITVPATYGAGASDSLASTKYALDIEYLQDWGVNATSFAEYLWDNEAATKWFSIEPTGDVDTVTGMVGQVIIPGTDYGGKADETWIAQVSCPCVEKPELVADTVVATAETTEDDE